MGQGVPVLIYYGYDNELQQANSRLAAVDWHHAYVREFYILSPSYPDTSTRMQIADGPPDARLSILTPAAEIGGVSFYLRFVETVNVSFWLELTPMLEIVEDKVILKFTEFDHWQIRAKTIKLTFLTQEECWGWKTLYGENLFDKNGYPADTDT
jgi:hypothetical protein